MKSETCEGNYPRAATEGHECRCMSPLKKQNEDPTPGNVPVYVKVMYQMFEVACHIQANNPWMWYPVIPVMEDGTKEERNM